MHFLRFVLRAPSTGAAMAGRSQKKCCYDLCVCFYLAAGALSSSENQQLQGAEENGSTQQTRSAHPAPSTEGGAESSGSGNIEEDSARTCPLCSEKFPSQDQLETHAMSVHSVNSEGLQRLQSLINGSHWLNNKKEGNYFCSLFHYR